MMDDDDELSPYDQMMNTQIQEELDALGLVGVPWDEVPDDMFDEAAKAAEKIVGPRPKE